MTGLTVVSVANEFTLSGQITLLILVEIGCLGLITCGTFLMVAIGRRLSLSSEFSLMNAYGVAEIQGVRSLILWVVGSMLVIESAGAALLYYRFHDWYVSIFYSVMSFCNAGFGIYHGSLSAFAADPFVILVLAAETILGGLGFLVIYNLCTYRFLRRKSGGKGRLSLHSAVVLRVSAYLLVIAFVVFLAAEWNGALKSFSGLSQKLYIAFYQAVTPRTCGFCVIPTAELKPITRHIYEILMFIGGAPGSAAAGIKVTTAAILFYTLLAMCRGESETVVSHRIVPYDIVRESIVIVTAMMTFIVVIMGALLITDGGHISSDALFFESVSAITTTGLSIGNTTETLSRHGKIIIMIAMFIGRLGALTVVMMIGDREVKRHVRYPSEELVVG